MSNPLKSMICLHDGQLDVSAIIKKNLAYSNFAFLSACQTSTGDKKLPEEVVHIAADVGSWISECCRNHVVDLRRDIAEYFYEALLDARVNEGSKIDGSESGQFEKTRRQEYYRIPTRSPIKIICICITWSQ